MTKTNDATGAGEATILAVRAGVATITLNRPEYRNALSVELIDSLLGNLDAALADTSVRVLVLTGTGNTFCAGADLKERRTVTAGADGADGGEEPVPTFVRVIQRIQSSPKPVVGRIGGHALAGGLGLACACDISVASDAATFGFTEVRLGLTPAIISVVCLPKLRTADAAELFLTGERVSAARAAEVGLINRAVPVDGLDAAVDEVVGKLLQGSPNAIAATKQLLEKVPSMTDQDAAFRWAAALSAQLFTHPEGLEGMAAFAERRAPSWVPAGQ